MSPSAFDQGDCGETAGRARSLRVAREAIRRPSSTIRRPMPGSTWPPVGSTRIGDLQAIRKGKARKPAMYGPTISCMSAVTEDGPHRKAANPYGLWGHVARHIRILSGISIPVRVYITPWAQTPCVVTGPGREDCVMRPAARLKGFRPVAARVGGTDRPPHGDRSGHCARQRPGRRWRYCCGSRSEANRRGHGRRR